MKKIIKIDFFIQNIGFSFNLWTRFQLQSFLLSPVNLQIIDDFVVILLLWCNLSLFYNLKLFSAIKRVFKKNKQKRCTFKNVISFLSIFFFRARCLIIRFLSHSLCNSPKILIMGQVWHQKLWFYKARPANIPQETNLLHMYCTNLYMFLL